MVYDIITCKRCNAEKPEYMFYQFLEKIFNGPIVEEFREICIKCMEEEVSPKAYETMCHMFYFLSSGYRPNMLGTVSEQMAKIERKELLNKECSICEQSLPMTEEYFYTDTTQPCGFKSACRDCTKKRRKSYAKTKDVEINVKAVKAEALMRKNWSLKDAAKHFGVSEEDLLEALEGEVILK